MSTPHRCPICLGKGELGPQKAKHDAIPIKVISKGNGRNKKIYDCHGCQGAGFLWDGIAPIFQPQPYIYPPQITWTNQVNVDPNYTAYNRSDMQEAIDYAINNVEITNGVARCKDCDEPLYMQPALGCQRTSSHTLPVAHYGNKI